MQAKLFPRRREAHLEIEQSQQGAKLHHGQRDRTYHLNRLLTLVWRHCDGHKSITQLNAVISQEANLHLDNGTLQFILQRLQNAELVDVPDARERVT